MINYNDLSNFKTELDTDDAGLIWKKLTNKYFRCFFHYDTTLNKNKDKWINILITKAQYENKDSIINKIVNKYNVPREYIDHYSYYCEELGWMYYIKVYF